MRHFKVLLIATLLFASPWALQGQTGYSVQSDGDDQLYAIDLATGGTNALGPTGFADVEALAFSPDGQLFAVDDATNQLLTCDTTTGACTVVGSLGVSPTDVGLAFGCDGTLYMSTDDPGDFYVVNPSTGSATLVGDQGQPVTALSFRGGLGSCSSGIFGLGGDSENNLVCIDPGSGAASEVGPLGGSLNVGDGGLDFDSSGVLWGIEDGGQIFTVDPMSGEATLGSTTLTGFESLAIQNGFCAQLPPDVPTTSEVGLLALALGLGALGLLAVRHR